MFITPYDYAPYIRDYILDDITTSPMDIQRATQSALEEVVSYLNSRYDIPACFPVLKFWAPSVQAIDTYVVLPSKPWTETLESTKGKVVQDGDRFFIVVANSLTGGDLEDTEQYRLLDYLPIYKALQEAPADKLPEVDTDYWMQADPRNAVLVSCVVDIMLYDLHKRIAPNQIPKIRQEARDERIEWLNRVARKTANPILPVPEDGTKDSFVWGSEPKRSNYL